jgi:hypothetical protein
MACSLNAALLTPAQMGRHASSTNAKGNYVINTTTDVSLSIIVSHKGVVDVCMEDKQLHYIIIQEGAIY